ncbi:MAG: hypothetical protein IPJ04_17915 [Candidatus Eisenbacteria bacterium]|nr:hypothetical protein [Candidatus Eisenbacteria bacterium]
MNLARILLLASLAVACFAATPRGAHAQDCNKVSYDSLRVVFDGRPMLRVKGSWGLARITSPRVEGALLHYASVRPDTVRHSERELPNPIALADLRRADVLGSNTLRGALIGALATGALLAVTSSSLEGGGTGGASSGMIFSPGSLSVLALGGGISLGALLGSQWHSWKPIYTRP